MEEKLIVCQCHNVEHQMIIYYDEEDNFAYVQYHLSPLSFFERLVHGIKYIFGYRSKYGDFDEIIVGSEYGQYFSELGKKLQNGKPSIV